MMETMKEKNSRTLLLEKETEEPSVESFIEENQEEKKESAKKVLFENNTPELYMQNLKKNFAPQQEKETKSAQSISSKIQFEAAETFFSKPLEAKEKKQTEGQVSFQNVYVPLKEEESETETLPEEKEEIEVSSEEETLSDVQEENISEDENKPVKRAKPKTRFRIFIFGLISVLACMCGWSIYNAVEIKTLTAEIEQANKIYSVNVYNYIKTISKADDLTNKDSITNLDSLSEAGIVPLQPTKEDKSEYSVKSNWFDRLCNWLSNLFN